MILQINLLPESRMLKLQSLARKRAATAVAVIIGVVVATVIITLVLLLGYTATVNATGKARVATLNKDIDSQRELEEKATTLQDNLAGFSGLQASRLYVSEIFRNLGNVIPAEIKIKSFAITPDYLVTISGDAPSFVSVSTFSKALQDYNVNFKPQPTLPERKPLFNSPVITSVSKSSDASTTSAGSVSFSMTFKVDPSLFSKSAAVGR